MHIIYPYTFQFPPFLPSFFLLQCTPLPRCVGILQYIRTPSSVKFVAQTFQDLNNHIFLELVQRIQLRYLLDLDPSNKYQLYEIFKPVLRIRIQAKILMRNRIHELVNCSEQNASVREFSDFFSP
jgi:hypothetical protein